MKSLPAHLLCSLGWSWHGQWRWEGYHVQALFQSPMMTNRTFKKLRGFWKNEFNGDQFEYFKPKKNQKTQSSLGKQNKRTTRPRGQKLNKNHVARKKLTEAKLKKAFRRKLLELCKTRFKTSCSDQFIFYVVLTGHDMVNDTCRATTCGRNFKAP